MRKLPPLSSLRAFEAAARNESFRLAAEELAVTPTAISHQVRLLEQTLGRKLFDRKGRRVRLTNSGQTLYPTLRETFDTMARAVDAVSAARGEISVVLTATPAFTARWLVPRMASFRSRFPDVGLRLLTSDDVVDLRTGVADIAIRFGSGNYPGCETQALLPGAFAPVCSPRLQVTRPEDMLRETLIHFEWKHPGARAPRWSRWFTTAELPYPKKRNELVFSDETHAIQAAVAGQGVVLANLALVTDDLRAGLLKLPCGPVMEHHAFHVVTPEGVSHPGASAVRDWLFAETALAKDGAAV
jgi:LysR family transcriptional regulator, glycine cleavage system transcriptional activator